MHDNVNVVVAVSAPVDWLPLVAFVPVQPPDAVQPVALVELHVNVADAPEATLVGFAVRVTVGAAPCTATVTLPCPDPPGPVQVSAKFVVVVSAPVDWVPLVAFVPAQPSDAVQVVALTEVHVSIDEAPFATMVGFASSVTTGGSVEWIPASGQPNDATTHKPSVRSDCPQASHQP